jgi:hypothetical protein
MTWRDAGGPANVIRAVFKVPRRGAEVDNMHAGALACSVDPDTGELGVARGKLPSQGEHMTHPDTGVAIRGTRLTQHRAAIALALRAHERLDTPRSVGWDVAMTPDGPCLIEGNCMWGADIAQAPHGAALDASFAATILDRARRIS